jgi:hypothetical protein
MKVPFIAKINELQGNKYWRKHYAFYNALLGGRNYTRPALAA